MFKLPNSLPTLRASPQDWADYAEYKALKRGVISFLDLIKQPLLISDEVIVEGVEDSTDKHINKADEIVAEVKRRILVTNDRYPFRISNHGYTLQYIANDSLPNLVYRFLLFSTRLGMTENKVQNNIDGTLLFEKLSAEVAREFFGPKANVDILGTSKAEAGGFRRKLSEISRRIGEGGTIHENPSYRPQDDNIDVIVWKGFTDKQTSQLIAFGQCKTGTSWQNRLSELNTDAFCRTWFSVQPAMTPLRMFFCAQYFPKEIWRPRANEAGLVFDRFRIIDYLPEAIDVNLRQDITNWLSGAEQLYNL